MVCPSCGAASADAQRFCGTCGAALPRPEAETMTSPAPRRMSTPPRIASDGERFLPGQVIAGRYRMIGPLGKGGMGEVYRADDLKLGQPVALKFLPREVERDADRLERFLNEVRLSLRVTHPNVCRVFDIGEVDASAGFGPSRHFISMEYVDGEDLASLLRRIGRLPEDKAVEIARQLCAGLAAAHDEGVLHRDLKPANVMIDGRGRAKITDFGLAGATAGIAGREAQVGTPQYMAPEQLDGRELSVQTDLYSLGLVLYELFTGKRAFDSRDVLELAQMRSATLTSPSVHVSGLNPVVERAILRCVEPDPVRRPKSASSLAAALPGGDPLAMAIAAGETPSPEMVARAGGGGELTSAIAAACLVTVLVGLGVIWYTEGTGGLQNLVPLPKPPAELRVAARAALGAAGYTGGGAGAASGFLRDGDYFNHITNNDHSVGRWDNLATVSPAPVWFWYRDSPRPMTPFERVESITPFNPPVIEPGMSRIRLDPSGRVQELMVVPADVPETPGPWTEPDWAPLFAAAGLTPGEWAAADPQWAPPHASDVRRAWTLGTVRLEAASFRGRPVWFRVIPDWRRPAEVRLGSETPGQRIASLIRQGLIILVIVGGVFLARRNIRQGRSDRRGAFRLAGLFVGLGVGFELMRLSGNPELWFGVFTRNFGRHVYIGALVWLFYVAVEPYVRRLWPGTLVAWSRVLEGRLRDPMVGRHILLGALAGMGFSLLFSLPKVAAALLGVPAPEPIAALDSLDSGRSLVASVFFLLQGSFLIPISVLLAVLVLRVIFRRPWLAYVGVFVIAGAITGLAQSSWLLRLMPLPVVALLLLVLTRLGLFAFLVGIVFSSWDHLALTIDPSSWFFPDSVIVMALFASVAIYGFWISLGDQKLFKDTLLDA